MTDKSPHTDTAHVLMERYYAGTASPDDIRAIVAMDRDGSAPADLRDDVHVVALIRRAGSPSESVTPPEGLYERLSAMIGSMEASERMAPPAYTRRRRRCLIPAAVAAAVVAAVFMAFPYLAGTSDHKDVGATAPKELVAEAVRHPAERKEPTAVRAEKIHGEPSASTAVSTVAEANTAKEPVAARTKEMPDAADDFDPYVNVTDSAEAGRVASDVMRLLASNMESAASTVYQSTEALLTVTNTFNSIMQ